MKVRNEQKLILLRFLLLGFWYFVVKSMAPTSCLEGIRSNDWGCLGVAGYNLQPRHLSSRPAPNFQPTATQETGRPRWESALEIVGDLRFLQKNWIPFIRDSTS